jgi:hypothetical protein
VRRVAAHFDHRSAVEVGLNGKARSGKSLERLAGPGRGASATCGPVPQRVPVPQRIEEPTTNRLVVGWNPTRSTTLISPVRSANCWRAFTSDARPKAEFTRLTVILGRSPGESKARNDLPQLPLGDGESGLLWKESGSAVEVPAVREEVLSATREAVRGRCAAPEREGVHDSQLPRGRQQRARHGTSMRRGEADGTQYPEPGGRSVREALY